MQPASPIKLSVKWVLLDVVGAILSSIGTYFVLESSEQKAVGYALMAIGIPMMLVAILQILKKARASGSRPRL